MCLYFWDVTEFSGVPEGREGQELRWVALSKLNELRFPDANQSIVFSAQNLRIFLIQEQNYITNILF